MQQQPPQQPPPLPTPTPTPAGRALRRLDIRDDRGVFAILYGLIVLVLAMVAALVVDIGLLRMDRSQERSAADAAASAGAGDLTQLPNSRSKACRTAFEYALLNLGETTTSASYPPCNTLPTTCNSSTPTSQVTGTSGRYTITIASPVGDGSPFMQPAIAPGSATQPINPTVDGTNCERIAVEVVASRSFLLGVVDGFNGASTGVHSVARAELTGASTTDVLIGLAALEPSGCHAVRVTGDGGIRVNRSTGTGTSMPGVIAVDSDGTGGSGFNDCRTGTHKVIEVITGNGYLRAQPSSSGQPGQIRSVALAGPQPGRAYEPQAVIGCNAGATSGKLCPIPISVPEPLTSQPWEDRYNCQTSGCATPAYVSRVDTQLGGTGVPRGYQTIPPAAAPPAVKAQFCGSDPAQTDLYFPSGNYYVDCPTWTILQRVGFGDGSTVILRGGLYIDDSGCFVIGVDDDTDRNLACAGSVPGSGSDSRLYLRNNGGITKERNGNLDLVDTFVRSEGKFDMQPGGNGDLRWTAPTSNSAGLSGLAYWGKLAPTGSEDSGDGATGTNFTHRIAGERSSVNFTGVFYAPNGLLQLDIAGSGSDTWRAQLAARRITAVGDVDLLLQPNTAWALQVPLVGTHLIR